METKDILAICIAAIALLISFLSFLYARAGYKRTVERDQREIEKEQPSVSLEMPACDGSGPWSITAAIRNRSTEVVVIYAIRIPLDVGDTPLPKRNPVRFAGTENVTHVTHRAARGEHGNYEALILERPLEPGATTTVEFSIVPEPRKSLEKPTPVRFYVDAYVRDRKATIYYLPVDRVARTTSHSAIA